MRCGCDCAKLRGVSEPSATRPPESWHGADPSDPAYLDDPYPYYQRLRAEHPVSLTPDGVWRVTRYDDCQRMLRLTTAGMRRTDGTLPGQDPAEAEERGQFMLLTDPPKHTRLRKLVSKGFTPRAISAWRGRIETVTDELLDRVAGREQMDLIADLALPVPSTFVAVIVLLTVPETSGVPEMTPVPMLMLSPAGNPLAPNDVGEFVAVMV